MKPLSGMIADAYATWLSSVSQCCAPLTSCLHEKPPHFDIDEKPRAFVLSEQPPPVPAPYVGPAVDANRSSSWPSEKDKLARKSFASSRTSFSVRKRFRSASSSRRPQISAPTNFRHLHSESFQFPQYTYLETVPRPRPASFRPLELSVDAQLNLSPILSQFDDSDDVIPPPPPAKLPRDRVDDAFVLAHERSYSSTSFHLPRRATDSSSPSTAYGDSPPRIPPKSRARANTSPNIEYMKERIASAMLEVEKLQEQIDSVIERQSIYAASSRPSTAHSMAAPFPDLTPMPSIPALPPAAPSFFERLNPGPERPQTAPPRQALHMGNRPAKPVADGSSAFITPPPSRGRDEVPLAPPLPLVLRPPLRKKKSFSRVSSWLFPGPEHQRDGSRDSITNLPRPIKGREGFYQCVPANRASERRSFDTVSTLSTWETEDEERTAPTTTWSPGSSPAATKQEEPPLERVATFGRTAVAPRRESVGVAF